MLRTKSVFFFVRFVYITFTSLFQFNSESRTMSESIANEKIDHLSAEDERKFGIVKWFNKMKGYGFVQQLNTENDYFVHFSQLKCSDEKCTKYLVAGEYVQFNISEPSVSTATNDDRSSQVAVDVTGIFHGPLMYENHQSQQRTYLQGNSFRYPRHSSQRNRASHEQTRRHFAEQPTETLSHRNRYDDLKSS